MASPLVALRDAARAIGQGNHDAAVEVTSQDEVGELAEAFERMRGAISARTRQLSESLEEVQRTHEALMSSRRLYLAIWESSPVAKWIFDRKTLRFMDVNDTALALYGYSREEFLQLTVKDLRPPEDIPRLLAALAEPRDERRFGTWSHRKKDGALLVVEVTSHDISIDGRALVCASVCDVTAAQRSEHELAASEERYRTLFEASAVPMWLWDAETFCFVAVNDATTRLYGYSREELVGKPLDLIMPEGDRPVFRERFQQAAHGKHRGERPHLTKGGKEILVEIASQRIVLDERPCVFTVARDVTDRRSLEAQLVQAQKMEAVGRLAGGIAHDFNNILAVILADAEWIATELGPDHVLLKDATSIATAAQRAAALTRQLLAFSRGQPNQPRLVQLNAVVSDTEKLLHRVLGEDVQLTCELDPTLGMVMADPSHMEQVLLNLAINARDAMPAGGRLSIRSANVEVGEARDGVAPGSYVTVSVTDTGCGMDGATMGHIFEPFFTTKEPGKGTGLGLSTVFGIVKQSGGAITVASEPARGTKLTVYLPRCERSAAESTPAVRAPSAGGVGQTILVVEDDEQVRRIVCRVLRAKGYDVIEASGAEEASVVVDDLSRRLNLVLSDVVMPGCDGVTFSAHIRRTRTNLPILLMSGYVDKIAEIEGKQRLLNKPFTPDQLTSAIATALEAA
jgi:two-component system, cell cycle sensor histidine kinase and response regulator CckA